MKTIKLELYSKSQEQIEDFEEDARALAEEHGASIEVN